MMANSNSLLECPICLEIPESEVYQCEEGHAVCARCYSKISNCPQCKVSYGKKNIRCRPIEAILDSMKFPCANEKLGCKQVLPRQEVRDHSKICAFRPAFTELCKLLGYNCDYIVKGDGSDSDSRHFRHKHGAQDLQTSCIVLQLDIKSRDIMNSSSSSDMIGTPVLLRVNNTGVILLAASLSRQSKAVSFRSVSLLSSPAGTSKSEFESDFIIKGNSHQVKDIKWTVPVTDLKTADLGLNWGFQIPVELLKAQYVDADKKLLTALVKMTEIAAVSEAQREARFHKADTPWVVATLSPVNPAKGKAVVVFSNVTCNECRATSMSGVRYKCLQCADFDICGLCMGAKKHNQHVFAMITNHAQQEYIRTIGISSSGWKILLPGTSRLRRSATSAFKAGCDGCGEYPIVGIRYTCLLCAHVDLCGNCIKLGVHPHHIFGVMHNSAHEDFLDALQMSGNSIIPRLTSMVDLREPRPAP